MSLKIVTASRKILSFVTINAEKDLYNFYSSSQLCTGLSHKIPVKLYLGLWL